MKKMRTLLTLLVVSICAVQSAWADRSAPQLPAAVALESGQSYYLYNVQEGKFACRSTTNVDFAALGTYGDKVTITATSNNGEYTIQWAYNNHYWYGYDTYIDSGYWSDDYSNFIIAVSSMGYTIQRSSLNEYYKADEYVGYNGNNGDRLNPALAEGSIHWRLMDVDEAEYYMAKHKLYTYLTIADTYNFYVTQYDDVYNDPTSTTELLNQAYETLYDAVTVSTNYVSPSWTEYPILFQNTTENKWENNNGRLVWYSYSDGTIKTSLLTGTINVDGDATVVYSYSNDNPYSSLRVFLDGELVQTVSNNQSYGNERRYYLEVTAGKHDVVWEAVCNDSRMYYGHYNDLSEIGIVNTPTLYPATTTVEGQLGTEVLKLIDPISKVKKIVITGVIGDEDWTTIGMMVNAFSIDMSGATATHIPESQFTKEKYPFLHSVKLPQGITSIGNYAFYESDIEDEITFPNALKTIGECAFERSKVKAAYMQNNVTSVGYGAFYGCYFLEYASWSSTASSIPEICFARCYNLRTFDIPEGVTIIEREAFVYANLFNVRFPSTMSKVGYRAFEYTATDRLYIHEGMTVNSRAFANCQNLVYAEWPTSFAEAWYSSYIYGTSAVVADCHNLTDVFLKSPTKVTYNEQTFFDGCTLSNITLHVPSYLVSTYKLDPYWYQCNVVGFDESEITDWYVKQPLVLNSERIAGTPNLHVSENGQIVVYGDAVQIIGDLSVNFNIDDLYYNDEWIDKQYCMMLSNTNKVNITGELSENIWTEEYKWYFLTLPFDAKVSDISNIANASYAIRYYDGANRASVGTGSNWKNYDSETVIPAGTGFIYQTSKNTCTKFVSQDNPTKQYILSNNEFVKALEAHDSEVTANKGWNLVGNPWQTYYNIHKLNFTAPITVWNQNYNRYDAYSIIDDDYAIKPLEAFFVQCPDEVNSITFPIDGRQLTDVIESQNGARQFGESTRKLVDIELTNGEMTDKTRFVLNPRAKMDYETTCDASKFFSMDNSVPQIYTIQNDVQLAINERPAGDGVVTIGVKIPADGTYTLKSERNALKKAIIVDKLNGTETILSTEGYTFSANTGTIDNRFELHLSAGETTGIEELKDSRIEELKSFYNLNGQRMNAPQKGINVVNGKKVIIK